LGKHVNKILIEAESSNNKITKKWNEAKKMMTTTTRKRMRERASQN